MCPRRCRRRRRRRHRRRRRRRRRHCCCWYTRVAPTFFHRFAPRKHVKRDDVAARGREPARFVMTIGDAPTWRSECSPRLFRGPDSVVCRSMDLSVLFVSDVRRRMIFG